MAAEDHGLQGVVLCGGRGQRLGKLTQKTPKPALLVNDRPLLLHIVEQLLRQAQISKLILVGNYLQDALMELINPMIDQLSSDVPVEWVTQRYPESEGALLTGVSCVTSEWATVRCGDDLLSDTLLRGLTARRGLGAMMSRLVQDSELPRLQISHGRIVGLTSDRNAPIMTYNLSMRTDLLLDWGLKAVADGRRLVEFFDQLPSGDIFAVDGRESFGLNIPEDYKGIERWYSKWGKERPLRGRE